MENFGTRRGGGKAMTKKVAFIYYSSDNGQMTQALPVNKAPHILGHLCQMRVQLFQMQPTKIVCPPIGSIMWMLLSAEITIFNSLETHDLYKVQTPPPCLLVNMS